MKHLAYNIYKTLRTITVTAIAIVVVAYAVIYAMLLLPAVQRKATSEGERFLSNYLQTHVTIGSVNFVPFNQLELNDVAIPAQNGDSLFTAQKLGAGISFYDLIMQRKLVFTYLQVIGLNAHITRPSKNEPTNMQFIVDAIKSHQGKASKPVDLKFYNCVIRKSQFRYDVLNAPHNPSAFDPNHLIATNIKADVVLPAVQKNKYKIEVKRLSFIAGNNLIVQELTSNINVQENKATISGTHIKLPNSFLSLNDFTINVPPQGNILDGEGIAINIPNSYFTPADLVYFKSTLGKLHEKIHITASVKLNKNKIHVPMLSVWTEGNKSLVKLNGKVENYSNINSLSFHIPNLRIKANGQDINHIVSAFSPNKGANSILGKIGTIDFDAYIAGTPSKITFSGKTTSSSLGHLELQGVFENLFSKNKLNKHLAGKLLAKDFGLGQLVPQHGMFNKVSLTANFNAKLDRKNAVNGIASSKIDYIDIKGHRYQNISAHVQKELSQYKVNVHVNDMGGTLHLDGLANISRHSSTLQATLDVNDLTIPKNILPKQNANNKISFNAKTNLMGSSVNDLLGNIALNNIKLENSNRPNIDISTFNLAITNAVLGKNIDIESDFLNGNINGVYDVKTLLSELKLMLAQVFPNSLYPSSPIQALTSSHNNITFNFNVKPSASLQDALDLPIKLVYNATLQGQLNTAHNVFSLEAKMPYLQQGNKIIENTQALVITDSITGAIKLSASALMPVKNGKLQTSIDATALNDIINTSIKWTSQANKAYYGQLSLGTLLKRTQQNKQLQALVDINPTDIAFNDTVWHVQRGKLLYASKALTIDNLACLCGPQFIKINGTVSNNPTDEVCVDLNDVSLDYIFNTLNISNVMFGGRALGKFYASNLLSGAPRLSTPNLHVDELSYNGAVMGNADIASHWDNANKAVIMNANIAQTNGAHSLVDGKIFTAADSLYFAFNATKANLEFMNPFMSAFAHNVKGYGSGNVVLLGNFHTIDLYGDVKVDTLSLKVNFTNVTYSCGNDSLHLSPGNIAINNVRIYDQFGNSAMLNGLLKHDHFHMPTYNFSVTNATNLLCFDTKETGEYNWYGTIFGNGSAFINGMPGFVNVKVNMSSAPHSKFNFILSDNESASEYKFITYRDRNQLTIATSNEAIATPKDSIPESVRLLMKKNLGEQNDIPTQYSIDLQADITPDLQMTLVMDPTSGDKIVATGNGNMHMTYGSDDEIPSIFGKYTLDRGNYNFTLQDVIIKDFLIKNGSSISFHGNPYAADLDIEAYYALNANIKDLDESFANDREINRTNVPVHALLKAKGALSQPDISFDLEFPTLTDEAYRRIKSIISTEDMMNRQIIYLLALNRFYTPDYMNNSTKNNELTSVASSTISSQLSNMLSQISENWSIAPNVRSDKGDFSDTEVDLALSSQLLNNRLLFNGNFGYRDNTYNTRNTSFIGDFDIDYLINKKGTIRLNAYNHFNDQNYYVRNALTTQGVGIVFKYDFNNPFDFLRSWRKKKKKSNATSSGSSTTVANEQRNK